MWMVLNETPYAADRNWAIDKHGAKSWIVAVRATFDVLPDGSTQIAAEQPPPELPEQLGRLPNDAEEIVLLGVAARAHVVVPSACPFLP